MSCLSQATGMSAVDFAAAVKAFDVDAREREWSDNPDRLIPQLILADLGVSDFSLGFQGVYYFHGTRTLDPSSFQRRGIVLPGALADEIWTALFPLVEDLCTRVEWQSVRAELETDAIGHGAEDYQIRMEEKFGGPFSYLVRDILFEPALSKTSSHDYLGCPELVVAISQACRDALGFSDLEARFVQKSVPCVIKYKKSGADQVAAETAVWFVRDVQEEGVAGHWTTLADNRRGLPVDPEDVVEVEQNPAA